VKERKKGDVPDTLYPRLYSAFFEAVALVLQYCLLSLDSQDSELGYSGYTTIHAPIEVHGTSNDYSNVACRIAEPILHP
jgi:hypothetical protein